MQRRLQLHLTLLVKKKLVNYHIPYFQQNRTVILSYKVLGDSPTQDNSPTIILFHDFLGSKRHWDGLGKTIISLTKRSVVTVDLRNHGDSAHASTHRYEEMAQDVIDLCNKLKIERASLVGHCMGGRTSMCVSLMQPKRVAGLLVVDTSPISTPKEYVEEYTKILQAVQTVQFKVKKLSKARKEASKQLRGIVKHDLVLKTIVANVATKNNKIGWKCNLEVLIKDFDYVASFPEHLKRRQYMGPTLFIGGQFSEHIPADDLPGIRDMFPRTVVKFIPKTGHYLQVDDPRSFLELAFPFLRKHE